MDDPFESPKLLLEGARTTIDDLKAMFDAYFTPDVYLRRNEIDPVSGEHVVSIGLSRPFPKVARIRVQSAINDIRHSLDQACFAACRALGTGVVHTYFPFAESPDELERLFTSRSRHIPEVIRSVIRSFEPFPTGEHRGGSNELRALGYVSGPNKHRVIIGAAPLSNSIRPHQMLIPPGFHMPFKWDAKSQMFEVYRYPVGAIAHVDANVEFKVVFRDDKHVEGSNVLDALKFWHSKASEIMSAIEAETL